LQPDRLSDDLAHFLSVLNPQPERAFEGSRSGRPRRLNGWTDPDDGLGSRLGSPATVRPFDAWLDSSARQPDPDDRSRYRWPARAAVAKLAREPVLAGCPPRDETLRLIARSAGDLRAVKDLLARRYPVMGDPETARAHFAQSLRRFAAIYTEKRNKPAAIAA
jgi:hypothetical protein